MPKVPSLEQFVEQQLQSGKYQSYEDMVQEGLRLLQERTGCAKSSVRPMENARW